MDALVLWCLFTAVAIAAMVTYARLPARELYQVKNPGIDTGIKRGLAFAGFPAAPVAVAVVWLLAEQLTRRLVTVAAVAATVLASAVFWPGAVNEADPDSRPISVVALVAVVAVIALTVGVARSAGFRRPRLHLREERARLLVFGLLFVVEIPWLAALIGVSLDHVPVLNSMFLSDSFVDQPGVAGLHPAVHAGLHHGLCGAMLVSSSLWLSRRLGGMSNVVHRRLVAGYLGLLIAYGGANALQDFWLEQIVKRDRVGWQFPYMLQPHASWASLGIVAGAALISPILLRTAAGSRTSRSMRFALLVIGIAGIASLTAGASTVRGAAPPPKPSSGPSELPGPDPLLRELIGFKVRYRNMLKRNVRLVRTVTVPYTAWNGARRHAVLVLPKWYGSRTDPAIPLVISPHGRGGTPEANARFWGGLPAFGPYAVVNPQGQGRKLTAYSWGGRGQIDDFARMPSILEKALPWFHVDRARVYAIGSSMGGQETLLLTALHPKLLTAAAPLDSATDMAARYKAFARTPGEGGLQRIARVEIGGTPTSDPQAYALRSPISYVQQLATSGVPIDIWWSRNDKIVVDQNQESGRLYRAIKRANPKAPVEQFVGTWAHSHEMHPLARLPLALVDLKIVELDEPLSKTVKP